MTHPIYRPPQPPLTKEDVEAMIAERIAEHTRQGMLSGAVMLAVLVGAEVVRRRVRDWRGKK